MAQLVVRNLDADVKTRLGRRAARHGRSMEAEVRQILADAVASDEPAAGSLGSRLAARFAGLGLDHDVAELRGEQARAATFDE